MNNISIRIAAESDAAAIAAIYAPYVENTAITFEYTAPSPAEICLRMKNTMKKYPYIVAECGSETVGYAYAGALNTRKAYDHCAEVSIYIKNDMKKSGIGKKLYTALEELLKKQNIMNLYACIAYPDTEDEYLTRNSEEFHAHLGYSLIGEFHKCGYKFGKWYNMVWMEKTIGTHESKPKDVIWFEELRKNP